MHGMRTVALIVGATLIAAVAVVAVMAATGSGDSQTTYAGVLTPTPKPDGLGNLSGMYDVQIHNGAKVITFYDCIARQDHDSITNEVKVTSQCYADIGLSDPNSALPCLPGEGADADCNGVPELDGPPPPPPYNSAPPTKMNGNYNPVTDMLTLRSCVPNIGGVSGPNILVDAEVPNAKEQLATTGKYAGTVRLYNNVSIAACESKDIGDQGAPLEFAINLNPIDDRAPCPGGDCEQVPWRTPNDTDYDDDGCTDFQELDKTGAFKCGDDPYNPYDSNQTDISGSYSMTATALRADWDKVLHQLIPGVYYECLADIQQEGDGKTPDSVSARVFCYIDSPLLAVNPEAGPEAGDGLAGAAPPGPYADVDDVQTELLGQIDNVTNTLDMEGCFEDRDVQSPLGNVYVRTVGLDVHTGSGFVELWTGVNPGQPECGAGPFVPGTGTIIPLDTVRNAPKGDPERDTDGDGCSDKSELGNTASAGGLRDPFNHWDYFNPTNDGLNRVDDILKVVGQYFKDYPAANYTRTTDRTAVIGANPWNLNKPNGQQRVDDILAAVKSYFHDCGTGTKINDDDPQFD